MLYYSFGFQEGPEGSKMDNKLNVYYIRKDVYCMMQNSTIHQVAKSFVFYAEQCKLLFVPKCFAIMLSFYHRLIRLNIHYISYASLHQKSHMFYLIYAVVLDASLLIHKFHSVCHFVYGKCALFVTFVIFHSPVCEIPIDFYNTIKYLIQY